MRRFESYSARGLADIAGYLTRHRFRESPGAVVHFIATPVTVLSTAPPGEQNAPGVTVEAARTAVAAVGLAPATPATAAVPPTHSAAATTTPLI